MIKTNRLLSLLIFASFVFSSCQPASTVTSPVNSTLSSSFDLSDTDQPQLHIKSGNNTAIITMQNTSSETIVKKDQTTYKNIASHTDAIYKKIENGVKEDIILYQKPPTPPEYKYTLELNNLQPHFFQGQYYFLDENGNSQLTIPKPYMFDSQNQQSYAVSITINNNVITITPDYNWLIDPQRQYPITVDPSFIVPDSPIQEVIDKRTISTKTYHLGDNKYAAVADNQILHYQDQSGNWQDINTAIIPSSDPEYDYMNLTNNYQTFFSTDGFGNKKAVKFQVKDAWMKFKITGASGTGQKNNAEGNKFSFDQIITNGDNVMDADYTLQKNQLLEEVILNKFQGYPNIAQEIELHNAVLKPDGKKINAYHTTTNELLWIIPEPVMYEVDLPENRNYDLHYQIDCTNPQCSTLILTKVIDPEGKNWLSDERRNYPLVIDTTAGPNSPGTAVNDASFGTYAWYAPSNALTSDNAYAYSRFGINSDYYSNYLKATNFGFSIPSGNSINGIVGEIEKKQSDIDGMYYVNDGEVRIVKSNGTIGTNHNKANSGSWPTTDTYVTYGNSTDLWGETWTYADINDADFGFVISVHHNYCNNCMSLQPNSLISTPQGYKKIKDIKNGDEVLSYNEKAKTVEAKTVTGVYSHPISDNNNRYFYIHYQDKIIKTTENHKFYINGSYVRADQLKVGNLLLGSDLKQYPIQKIDIVSNTQDFVWDITVQDNHNFFVEDILTHNFENYYVDHMRLTVYYSESNSIPTAPSSLLTEGLTNPTGVIDLTPEFKATFSDPDTGDTGVYYQIQVNTNNTFTGTTMWDSTKTAISPITNGTASPDISYANTNLSLNGTTYYWRIKFWDQDDAEGAWSAAANFTMDTNIAPNTPTLDLPTNTATNVAQYPTFKTTATDSHSDNLQYKIQICTNSSMTENCQTYDQTSSQTGWSGQNADGNTTYTSGTQATFTSSVPLASLSTYYWRTYAIDPTGSNTWSNTQTPYSFTTIYIDSTTELEGVTMEGVSIE